MLLRALVLALFAPAAAPTEPPAITFRWERGPGAEACPDRATIADAVAARLGYPPFDEQGARLLLAEVQAAEGEERLTGVLKLYDAEGELVGERTLHSERRDCAELARALELAIAIAIDPAAVTRPAPPRGPPPPAEPAEPPAPEAAEPGDDEGGATTGRVDVIPDTVVRVPNTDADRRPTVPEPLEGDPDFVGPPRPPDEPEPEPEPASARLSRDPLLLTGPAWQLTGWSGLTFASGTTPAPTFGLTSAGLGLRYRLVSGMLELRHDAPQSAPSADGQGAAVAWLSSLSGHLCVHSGWMYGCGSGAAGVLRAGGIGLSRPRLVTLPYLAVGGRAGADLPLLGWLHPFFELWRLRLHADLYAPVPFLRWRLRHDLPPHDIVWQLPPVAVVLGAAIVFAVPP